MHKLLKLCKLPRRPSEVLELRQSGVSAEAALDFDYALLDFDDWYQAKANEMVWQSPDRSHEGKVQVPKYRTVGEIMGQYRTEPDPAQWIRDGGYDIDVEAVAGDVLTGMEPQF